MDLAAFFAQGVFVKQVLGHPVRRGAHATQVADVVAQLLDGLHLFVQVVALQEVVHLKKQEGGQSS